MFGEVSLPKSNLIKLIQKLKTFTLSPKNTLSFPNKCDILCGASAAGSCCGCKKTPYLGQIARNLSFAAAWIASRGHGKKRPISPK